VAALDPLFDPTGLEVGRLAVPVAGPIGIGRAVQWLEENFATKAPIEKLAVPVGLSPLSLAHPWSSGPTSGLSKYGLGVWPVSPGYKTWRISSRRDNMIVARHEVPGNPG
jgi:hypothetical protein